MEFAVIFDFDGTIVDSTTYIPVIAQKVASEYDILLSPAERAETTQFPFQVWVGNWNKLHNRSIDYREVIHKYAGYEKEYLRDHSVLSKNIESILKELHAHNVPVGIATSAPRERLNNILRLSSIDHFFSATVSIDDVQRSKPDPEPYLKAANVLGIPPSQCVGIEDTPTGLSSVINAGMKSIAYARDPAYAQKLINADRIITNFSELSYSALEKMFN